MILFAWKQVSKLTIGVIEQSQQLLAKQWRRQSSQQAFVHRSQVVTAGGIEGSLHNVALLVPLTLDLLAESCDLEWNNIVIDSAIEPFYYPAVNPNDE